MTPTDTRYTIRSSRTGATWPNEHDGAREILQLQQSAIRAAHSYARIFGTPMQVIESTTERHIFTVYPQGKVTNECCCTYEAKPSLLSLIRSLIDARNKTGDAVLMCDNHYQAGYDAGHELQYQQESDARRAAYYAASDELDRIEQMIFAHLGCDGYDFSRAQSIASRYA